MYLATTRIYVIDRERNLAELLLVTERHNVWLQVQDHADNPPHGEICIRVVSPHKDQIISFLEDYGYYEGLDAEEVRKFNAAIGHLE